MRGAYLKGQIKDPLDEEIYWRYDPAMSANMERKQIGATPFDSRERKATDHLSGQQLKELANRYPVLSMQEIADAIQPLDEVFREASISAFHHIFAGRAVKEAAETKLNPTGESQQIELTGIPKQPRAEGKVTVLFQRIRSKLKRKP